MAATQLGLQPPSQQLQGPRLSLPPCRSLVEPGVQRRPPCVTSLHSTHVSAPLNDVPVAVSPMAGGSGVMSQHGTQPCTPGAHDNPPGTWPPSPQCPRKGRVTCPSSGPASQILSSQLGGVLLPAAGGGRFHPRPHTPELGSPPCWSHAGGLACRTVTLTPPLSASEDTSRLHSLPQAIPRSLCTGWACASGGGSSR